MNIISVIAIIVTVYVFFILFLSLLRTIRRMLKHKEDTKGMLEKGFVSLFLQLLNPLNWL